MSEFPKTLSGKFVVLDGPDGTGKSTQTKLLGAWLSEQGVKVCPVRDPGGTVIGDKIRGILLDKAHDEMNVACETMLYMASRAQLAGQIIGPALARGECVVCDRYVSSTIAYQGAGGVDPATVRKIGEFAVGRNWPDLTVILDLPAEVGLSRVKGGLDRMESKGLDFHRRVRELFLRQAKESRESFAVIDASGSVEQVQGRLRDVIQAWKFRP